MSLSVGSWYTKKPLKSYSFDNWRMIVDVDFGALHFCRPRDAKSRYVENAEKYQKFGFSKLAPIVPQKCFAPKFTSTIILQFIQMVTGAKISSQTCFI